MKGATKMVISADSSKSLTKIEAEKTDAIALDELMKALVAETSRSTAQAKLNADTIVYKGRRVLL